jgi:hypothetical protein
MRVQRLARGTQVGVAHPFRWHQIPALAILVPGVEE